MRFRILNDSYFGTQIFVTKAHRLLNIVKYGPEFNYFCFVDIEPDITESPSVGSLWLVRTTVSRIELAPGDELLPLRSVVRGLLDAAFAVVFAAEISLPFTEFPMETIECLC